ncbi:MAG: radical SAM protein [Acidobacteriota bacterium]|nr:MAG: radical SAM protein [Acidobacteriota bacterium]
MRSNVLLVLPIREGNNYQIAPDLGLLYLGTALRKQGYRVTILDCPKENLSFSGFRDFVREGGFEVVGFRCYSRDHNYVRYHSDLVKTIDPGILTLTGGPQPSALPEFVLNSMPGMDFAWNGEAEEGLPRLLTLFEDYGREIPETLLDRIPGLVWRNSAEERVVCNPTAFSPDLDRYGIPGWDMVRPDTYPGFIWDEYYPLVTTRGCPFPCTYCNAPNLSGKKLRHRSPEHVVEELRLLKKEYGISRFSVLDDEFTLNKKYVTSLCEALIEAGLGLQWDCPNGVRIDSLYPEMLQLMEQAGCESLAVGIESGTSRIQKLIDKRVTVEKIREKADMIAGCSGIKLIGYFMIGFLDETEEEIQETLKFACSLPLKRANFNVVIPIPGTRIFSDLLEQGLLKLDDINWDTLTSDQIAFKRNHVSGKRLLELQRRAYLKFYGRPKIARQLVGASLKDREVILSSLRKLRMLSWRKETYTFEPMYLREKALVGDRA